MFTLPTLVVSPIAPICAHVRDGTPIVIRAARSDDGVSRVVLAAVTGDGAHEEVHGLGRYVVLADRSDIAEVAFEVGDADQGHGIGTLLLEHLARIAHERGVRTFRAEVEADNAAMLDVFEHSGLTVHETCSRGIYDIGMSTADTARFVEASAAGARVAAVPHAPGGVSG